MKSCSLFMNDHVSYAVLILSLLFASASAYTRLIDSFLRNVTSSSIDFDSVSGTLLSPFLTPRVPGTTNHTLVQSHITSFFATNLSKWTLSAYNSTVPASSIPITNLVFSREPPWTRPGQANFLTLAAHYDSKEGMVGATDGAVPCAVLMHVASSIDRYVSQMHDEMSALGEGGTVEMDMGVQIVFLDGREPIGGDEKGMYGSRALSEAWEAAKNPAGSGLPTSLSQISMFLLLDVLGASDPKVPSYVPTTHWAYKKLENLEQRLRNLGLLESFPTFDFFPVKDETTMEEEATGDYSPFIKQGVPLLHLRPDPLPPGTGTVMNNGANLDGETVRDWAKIVTGFALEWLDMMEVWPE